MESLSLYTMLEACKKDIIIIIIIIIIIQVHLFEPLYT